MASTSPSVNLLPLLKKISANAGNVEPDEITAAISAISAGQSSHIQTAALLTALHYTGLDCNPGIIAGAATAMRAVGLRIPNLSSIALEQPLGTYQGGLVDMVGTGGDGHDTYNVSTTAAVVAAGCGLRICKHGSNASTSSSGSADLIKALGAEIEAVDGPTIARIFSPPKPMTDFAFIYAKSFHPAMKHITPVRQTIGCRTIFNVLGPLISPVDYSVGGGYESRLLGVGKTGLGPVYADTLRLLGVKKGMVVCGEEHLDEVSIAGYTLCWKLHEKDGKTVIETFRIHPAATFGLQTHALTEVAGGKGPNENAVIFENLLNGKAKRGDPVKDFVVINVASLLVVSGAVEGDDSRIDGVACGSMWTKARDMAENAMDNGSAWKAWRKFVDISREAAGAC